jgi:ADP-ribosylation factor GTPase-activating protein 1
MDAWNPDQLRKMQAGGNGKLNAFFQQHGVDKATDIKVKYNNKVAEVGRHKRAPSLRVLGRHAARQAA